MLQILNLNTLIERNYPKELTKLMVKVGVKEMPLLIRRFLFEQKYPEATPEEHECIPHDFIPARSISTSISIKVFHSAISIYHAPSDPLGVHGMRREIIRATPMWRNGCPRYDTVFISTNPSLHGFRGLHVARVRLFFSFTLYGKLYPCALVHWFEKTKDEPDEENGMWVVEPDLYPNGEPVTAVIHIDSIVRAAHLMPVYTVDGTAIDLPSHLKHTDTLDYFKAFYVNKYIDHHAHEFAF